MMGMSKVLQRFYSYLVSPLKTLCEVSDRYLAALVWVSSNVDVWL
jgi:hypothetical protein